MKLDNGSHAGQQLWLDIDLGDEIIQKDKALLEKLLVCQSELLYHKHHLAANLLL